MFALSEGQLSKDGKPFFSVGFNYHPSSSGCNYWNEWDPNQINDDLQKMAALGFNTVRFFTFWADFEPVAGQFDTEKVLRLKQFVSIAHQHDLYCIPSLLTIWMNGQLFYFHEEDGHDLWTDPKMLRREVAYVQHVATALRDSDNILAYDLGDEVVHVNFELAKSLSRSTVEEWLRLLSSSIREVDPNALVVQANELSAILGQHHFTPVNIPPLDLVAIHGFPIWSPFAIESNSSYKATNLVPFLVSIGRQYGPILIDELACYGADDNITKDYLRATAHSALANGASGIIVWCWQDFASKNKPYILRPDERVVGLIDKEGNAKPALTVFQDFAMSAVTKWAGLRPPHPPIGIYLANYAMSTKESNQEFSASTTISAFYSYLLLKRAHLPFEFTSGRLNDYKLVICPSVEQLTLYEQEMLSEYVQNGGSLYYSAANYLHGFGGEELFGVRLKDFTLVPEEISSFVWHHHKYSIEWNGDADIVEQIPIIEATSAEVLTTYGNGSPAFTRHTFGKGVAFYLNAPLEKQLNRPFRLVGAPWHLIYDYLAECAGITRDIDVDSPDIELASLEGGATRFFFIINHSPQPVRATATHYNRHKEIVSETFDLEGKDVKVVAWRLGDSDNDGGF